MSSGVELGGGKKKKKEERRPSEAIPPPPSGPAPTWDNNIFTNGKALEVEMSSFGFKNPLHEKKEKEKKEKKTTDDKKHIARALTFKKKSSSID